MLLVFPSGKGVLASDTCPSTSSRQRLLLGLSMLYQGRGSDHVFFSQRLRSDRKAPGAKHSGMQRPRLGLSLLVALNVYRPAVYALRAEAV
jgi:hypothetical protein